MYILHLFRCGELGGNKTLPWVIYTKIAIEILDYCFNTYMCIYCIAALGPVHMGKSYLGWA